MAIHHLRGWALTHICCQYSLAATRVGKRCVAINRRRCIGYDLARLTEPAATDILVAYARRRGWELNHDHVYSETSERRQTTFKRMLRVLRPEDTVLIASLSRLPSGTQSLLLLVKLFECGRVSSIILINDSITFSSTNPACRRYTRLLLAQERSAKQLRSTKSKIALRLASLMAVQVAEIQRKVMPEIELEVLRLRFNEKMPIREIARRLKDGTAPISRGSVQGILRRHSKAMGK